MAASTTASTQRKGTPGPPGEPAKRTGLGTFAGVFTPSVLTILGLILFRRLGWVVGAGGLAQALMVMAVAATIALITSASLSAIATNLRVKGGGDYYLISRSLGVEFGGAIGVVLFAAQSISVAFYVLGFGEAIAELLPDSGPWTARLIAGGATLVLFVFAWLGSDWATRLQYVVMAALFLGLLSFFIGGLGSFSAEQLADNWSEHGVPAAGFWVLFALYFPAVTGFTQGVSMSGDLKDPGRSLPIGTFLAVGVSMVIYVAAAVLFSGARSNAELVANFEAMNEVAWMPVLITVGIVAATLSSALASFMGAPRILQALASDEVFPALRSFAHGAGPLSNPRRGVVLTLLIALGVVSLGGVDTIAPIVAMFFLISYGLLNYATALEARANSPSFRPRFRFFHYRLSLVGALGCLGLMVMIDPLASAVALALLFALYQYIQRIVPPGRWSTGKLDHYYHEVRSNLRAMAKVPPHPRNWRPTLLVFSHRAERRERLVRLASWVEGNAGITTVVEMLEGSGDQLEGQRRERHAAITADLARHQLNAFVRVIAAPDLEAGQQTLVQSFGLGPLHANCILLNWFGGEDGAELIDDWTERLFVRHLRSARRLGVNVVVFDANAADMAAIASAEPEQRRVDIWWTDDASGRLMLLLAYMMTRTSTWARARLRLLVRVDRGSEAKVAARLEETLGGVRIEAEIETVVGLDLAKLVQRSQDASLVFLPLRTRGNRVLDPFGKPVETLLESLPAVAMLSAAEDIDLDAPPEEPAEAAPEPTPASEPDAEEPADEHT